MRFIARLLICTALLGAASVAHAQRAFNQGQLDAMLAPIALYPDAVLTNILVAARYPDDVREAAAWSRNNPQLRGDEALSAVEPEVWHPSVKSLVAFPDVLARMAQYPDWLRDLGEAYRAQGPNVMDTVQALRRRAQANGNLQSDARQQVYDDNGALVVAPASPQVVYVPYYDPYVVYGGWWWPAYRPVVWAPWPVYGAFISVGFFATRADWHHRAVVFNRPIAVNRPATFNRPAAFNHPVTRTQFRPGPDARRFNGPPAPSVQMQRQAARQYVSRMSSANHMPPAQGFHGAPAQRQSFQGHSGGQHGGRRG